MGINENQLVSQLQQRAERLRRVQQRRQNDLEKVVAFYKSLRQSDWLSAEELSAISQAGALPLEELNRPKKVQLPAPVSYLVVATDGSIIPPDRHGGMDFCYVLNVGEIALGYGERYTAHIESNTRLQLLGVSEQAGQEADRDSGYKSDNKQALLLDAEMAVEELRVALKLATENQANAVLRDGPLTLWASSILNNSQGKKLTNEYLALIGEFEQKNIPVVGYISNTRSDSVITALKVLAQKQYFAQLPETGPTTKNSRSKRNSEPSAGYQAMLPLEDDENSEKSPAQLYEGLLDADLFRQLLAPGEYSPAFRQSARHSKDTQLTEQIYFCYLRTEYELVKLEFSRQFLHTPQLEEALAIVWRQMELGQGYPVALMEAHESAVLRTADRELLRVLLEDYGLIGQESQKGISKRLRGI